MMTIFDQIVGKDINYARELMDIYDYKVIVWQDRDYFTRPNWLTNHWEGSENSVIVKVENDQVVSVLRINEKN